MRTVQQLSRRIEERFPDANLIQACNELLYLSKEAKVRAEWIARPIVSARIAAALLISLIAVVIVSALAQVRIEAPSLELLKILPLINATINNIVLLAAVMFFLITIESRVKRKRALCAIHELRSLAHVIDMYQLTKDPDRVIFSGSNTCSSPENSLDLFEMSRYLDYCGEMLSLIGKIASIYSQNWRDDTALQAVNDIERLTAGLAQKIFQKIMILHGTLRTGRGQRISNSGAVPN